jgi:2-phosphosulfolactate phosphatase
MPNIHLLVKKEDIDDAKLSDNKIAVVFDVLLATSTITSALYHGAKEVIPVLNREEAIKEAEESDPRETILVGEYDGKAIDGFLVPHPNALRTQVKNKTMILSTTNGTVAIRKAASAKRVYIGSILNGQTVADTIRMCYSDETVVVICSGSSGAFSLEDFYGAGYFLDCLVRDSEPHWELTDPARAALLFFRGTVALGDTVLKSSTVGRMLMNYGLEEVIEYVVGRGSMPIAPILMDKKRIVIDR